MCDLRRERFYGLLRGKEPLTSKVRSAVLDKTFFHRKVSFLVVFVQRIYQKDGKKGFSYTCRAFKEEDSSNFEGFDMRL